MGGGDLVRVRARARARVRVRVRIRGRGRARVSVRVRVRVRVRVGVKVRARVGVSGRLRHLGETVLVDLRRQVRGQLAKEGSHRVHHRAVGAHRCAEQRHHARRLLRGGLAAGRACEGEPTHLA